MLLLLATALVALVLVGVTLAINTPDAAMADAARDTVDIGLPDDRPMVPDDVDRVRFSVALRGYRMSDVDQALDRLRMEIAVRDARIRQLESGATEDGLDGGLDDVPDDILDDEPDGVPDDAAGREPSWSDYLPPA